MTPVRPRRPRVTQLDVSTGKVVFVSAGKSVNFVHETGAGVVMDNDQGEVVLLDKSNCKAVWWCRLEKKTEIKALFTETDEVASRPATASSDWSAETESFSFGATTPVRRQNRRSGCG